MNIRKMMTLGMFGGRKVIIYLLLDQFTNDDPSPLTTPRTCEPGPGTLTAVETDGSFAISGGKLVFTAQTTPNFGDQRLYNAVSQARVNSPMFVFTLNIDTLANGKQGTIGWNAAVTGAYLSHALYPQSTGKNLATYNGGDSRIVGQYTAGVDYKVAVILRPTAGAYYIIQGGTEYSDPVLIWVDWRTTTASLYHGLSNYDLAGNMDDWKLYKAPGSWATDFGPATNRVVAPANGEIISLPAADGMVDIDWTPAANEILDLMVRRTDDNNCWIVRADQAAGTLKLLKKEAGIEAAAVISTAQVLTVGTLVNIRTKLHGNTIDVYTALPASGGVYKGTYASASFNNTATGAKVSGSTQIANLISWPRTVSLPFDFPTAECVNILPVGDSKTLNYGWPALIADYMTAVHLGQKWEESPARIADNNYTVALRLTDADADLAAAIGTPNYILFDLGANDVASLPAEATWKANYLALIDKYRIKWPSTKIFISKAWRRGYTAECASLAGWIDWIVTQRADLYIGDNQNVWMENGDDGATYTVDGVHYSTAGTAKKATELEPIILAHL